MIILIVGVLVVLLILSSFLFSNNKQKVKPSDIANNFGHQLDVFRLAIYKTVAQMLISTGYGREDARIIAVQVGNYLVGDNPDMISSKITEEVRNKIIKFKPRIHEFVRLYMQSNKENRGLIVYILRRRLIIERLLIKVDYKLKDYAEERIKILLEKYGAEFPEAESDSYYNELYKSVAQIAKSNI